jgi:Leucine-rich repeat (LRR) protein
MNAINLDISDCPELEELTYCGYVNIKPHCGLDLSGNTKLKYLNCSDNGFTSLNLNSNTALEEINCSRNYLSHLSLSNNCALKKLNCEYNEMEKIFIYYAPQLREIAFEEGNKIDDITKMQIQELIAENNAENE